MQASLEPEEESPDLPADADQDWLARLPIGPSASQPATRNFGQYELLERIGQGGMGSIFKARQARLNRLVAVKMILAGPLASAEFVARFRTEAEAAASLDHPHIVPIYEVGEHEGQHYYSMRLVEGPNLAQELRRRGPLPPGEAAALVATVARAVYYAHQHGVLHRDLKPANILLDARGQPHVSDFGLAKLAARDSGLTLSQAALGTPSYMAPEQAAGKTKQLSTGADIYSLGAILFELLSGHPPFEADSTVELLRKVSEEEPVRPSVVLGRTGREGSIPRDLETICLRCLQKEPARRYASAQALAEDLERWRAGEPIQARRVKARERLWLWARRKPALAGLVVALGLTVVVGTSVAAWRIAVAREAQRREQYRWDIALADHHITNGDIDRARELLKACPARYRQWEWGRLMYLCHQAILTIPAHTNSSSNAVAYLWDMKTASLAFSPDSARLVTLGADGVAKAWSAETGGECFAVGSTGHRGMVVAYRPDSQELAFGCVNGAVHLHSATDGRLLGSVVAADGGRVEACPQGNPAAPGDERPARATWTDTTRPLTAISGLAYSPDGTKLASAVGQVVRVWDTATRQERFRLEPAASPVRSIWFSPDSRWLIVKEDARARVWDADTGGVVAQRTPPTGGCLDFVIGPAGDTSVTIDPEDRLVFELPDGSRRVMARSSQQHPTWRTRGGVFSQSSRWFCTQGEPGDARVWSVADGQVVFTIARRVQEAVFSPDERYVATLNAEPVARLYELATGREVVTYQGHGAMVLNIAFSPDGLRVATASLDGVVKVWSARPGRDALATDFHIGGGALSRDGRWTALTPVGATCEIWDVDRAQRTRILAPAFQHVFAMDFSPDARYLATGGTDQQVRIWELSSGREVRTWVAHQRTIALIQYNPKGDTIATASFDGTAGLWEADTGRLRHRLMGHSNLLYRAVFSPDGRSVATASYDHTARVWDAESGRCRFVVRTGFAELPEVQFSPDGRRLATAGDGVIQLWDARDGRRLDTWSARQGIMGFTFSPDGQRLVVSTSEGGCTWSDVAGVEVWDAELGHPLLRLRGHSAVCLPVAFATDGRRFVTCALDQTTRVWETFPWRESEFPGPSSLPLAERAQRYAAVYWRQRLEAERAEDNARSQQRQVEGPSLQGSAAVSPPGQRPPRSLWPPRDPDLGSGQVDLTEYYTGLLTCLFHPTVADLEYDDTLVNLPRGMVSFSNVVFDVRGVVLLRKQEPRWPTLHRLYQQYPKAIEGVRVGRHCRSLHVLHGVVGNRPDRGKGATVYDGTRIGSYRLHYVDGRQHEFGIVYGQDVREWWRLIGSSEPETTSGRVVWTGTNGSCEAYEATLRLYLRTYANPHPELEVSHIDFVSDLTLAAPFLVAMTVE